MQMTGRCSSNIRFEASTMNADDVRGSQVDGILRSSGSVRFDYFKYYNVVLLGWIFKRTRFQAHILQKRGMAYKWRLDVGRETYQHAQWEVE